MKVAVIGTSNTIIKVGYFNKLKRKFENSAVTIDRYSLGGTTSLTASYMLEKFNIINNYDYIVLDFNINDYKGFIDDSIPPEICIALFANSLLKIVNSNSKAIVLVLKDEELAYCESYQKLLAIKFNVPIIEINETYLFGRKHKYLDTAHFTESYQNLIANRIYEKLTEQSQHITPSKIDRSEFDQFDIKLLSKESDIYKSIKNSRFESFKNSLVNFNCFILNDKSSIEIHSEKDILKGMVFYSDKTTNQSILIDGKDIKLRKNISLDYRTSGFFTRLIDIKNEFNLKDFILKISADDLDGYTIEQTMRERRYTDIDSFSEVKLVDLIFANKNINKVGQEIIDKLKLGVHCKLINILHRIRNNKPISLDWNELSEVYKTSNDEEKVLILDIISSYKKSPQEIINDYIKIASDDHLDNYESFRLIFLSKLLFKTGRITESIEHLTAAMKIADVPKSLKLEYAKYLDVVGKTNEALRFLTKELEENQDWESGFKRASILYKKINNLRLALEYGNRAYKLSKKQNDKIWVENLRKEIENA